MDEAWTQTSRFRHREYEGDILFDNRIAINILKPAQGMYKYRSAMMFDNGKIFITGMSVTKHHIMKKTIILFFSHIRSEIIPVTINSRIDSKNDNFIGELENGTV
ncbi:MAG TPA: hypothetical protein ACFYD7_01940 [Candidatus Wujingus californicus]|uniref:hypothetical protein n=1 Tax=Candidatus Wujingus californicus TaxID=3367618 RepID=UPI001DBD4DAF|nr:hypothetical protein [Planctomycetota bacterium]MDO8131249.1 hypothetical protein [Candidatus Brocadiales bacterium]